MAGRDEICPDCGGQLEWDEVDIGVGVQRGPTYCLDPDCEFNKKQQRWQKEADRREKNALQADAPGDWGGKED